MFKLVDNPYMVNKSNLSKKGNYHRGFRERSIYNTNYSKINKLINHVIIVDQVLYCIIERNDKILNTIILLIYL